MKTREKMPVIFIGHGSPMNAIEENIYTESWLKIAGKIPRPKTIILFSAHWITEGFTMISNASNPEMIYDMYGFPPELYRVSYPANGNPDLASQIIEKLGHIGIETRGEKRGLDHGEWSVLRHLFPKADIPVVSVSIDYHLDRKKFLEIGSMLRALRDEGILIMGSGNIVHNLRAIDWSNREIYPWARDFDEKIEQNILSQNFANIANFESWNETKYAHPTVDHFLPLLPLLGTLGANDEPTFFTPDITMGSLSMRSVFWGQEK